MKIILTQSIKGIGRKGEVKEFPQGYAQNFIIKKGYGVIATEQAIQKNLSEENKKIEESQKNHADLINAINKSNDLSIEFKVQANEYGILFSSIHKKEILLELKKKISPKIEERMIFMDSPIKKTGEYEIKLSYEKYTSKVKISVKK